MADEGRRADLKRIEKRLATPRADASVGHERMARESALKTRRAIMDQSKDRKLAKLRRGLFRAVRARDKHGELLYNARIKLHTHEEFADYE